MRRKLMEVSSKEWQVRWVMIRANEIRRGLSQIQYSLAALDETRLQPRAVGARQQVKNVRQAATAAEIDLSVSQVLSGFAFSLFFLGFVVWGAFRYWLFAK
jgi:hypothetical protein